jgi:hypothetical protein
VLSNLPDNAGLDPMWAELVDIDTRRMTGHSSIK